MLVPDKSALPKLREFLGALPAGAIAKGAEVVSLLADAWAELDGSDDEAMAPYKVARAELLHWDPPNLSFLIERHGGTVQGSKRAELHQWTVDVVEGRARCSKGRMRQLSPNAPAFTRENAAAIASRIAALIVAGKQSNWLVRNKDGTIRVEPGEVLPGAGVAKQTLESRRKRLRLALETELKQIGLQLLKGRGPWTFGKSQA